MAPRHVFVSLGHMKLPSNQTMVKAVEKDTRNIAKKYDQCKHTLMCYIFKYVALDDGNFLQNYKVFDAENNHNTRKPNKGGWRVEETR